MNLTAANVDTIIKDCLAGSKEDHLIVEGLVHAFGFDRKKLEEHRADIQSMIDDVPDVFHRHSGGGMTFLNLCEDRHGNLWTGLHRTMEALVVLGIAIDRAAFPIPRVFWSDLPGKVPYVMFLHSSDTEPLTQAPPVQAS